MMEKSAASHSGRLNKNTISSADRRHGMPRSRDGVLERRVSQDGSQLMKDTRAMATDIRRRLWYAWADSFPLDLDLQQTLVLV